MNMQSIVERWQGRNNAESGSLKDFKDLIAEFGYQSVEDFLTDNPGALEALMGFIVEQDSEEWKESLSMEGDDNEAEEPNWDWQEIQSDFATTDEGNLVMFLPLTDEAKAHLPNLGLEGWQWLGNRFGIDRRLVDNFVSQLQEDGFSVT